jgi:hypothetical protein
MVGSPLATYLYNVSEHRARTSTGPDVHGALPLQVVGAILVCSAFMLLAAVALGGVTTGHHEDHSKLKESPIGTPGAVRRL